MAKKKQVKKLNSKKLEDRIAPGMVGGGLVDPGMVDAVEIDQAGEGTHDMAMETEAEHFHEGGEPPQGEYLDEAGGQPHMEGGEPLEGEDDLNKDDEFKMEEEVDEFAQDEPPQDFTEDQGGWQEPDWVSANADGSFDVQPPEGVTVDPDAGIANFPVDVANEELPLPDDVEITAEGGLQVGLPEGAEYLEGSNQLLLQDVPLEEIPDEFDAHANPDGSVMVNLPDQGVEVDMENNQINFDNHWANEMAPENVDIQPDGSVDVHLPENGVEYNDDGSLHFEPDASAQMNNPPDSFYAESDYCEPGPDGSVTVQPPEGVTVDGGVIEMDANLANEHLDFPQEFELNADGTANVGLPEGAEFNADANCINFPEGEMHLENVPEGVDAHINPDGTTSVMLQDGMEYDAENHQVNLDNHWVNEVTPDSMNVTPDGEVQIAAPEGTEFYDDGSFNIPAEDANFMNEPSPEFVADVEWAEPTGEHYHAQPPEGMEVNPENHSLNCPNDMIDEHIPMDDEIHINADGTMDVGLPDGTTFDVQTNTLNFPEGSMPIQEIPEEVTPTMNDDGSITVNLQPGMAYDVDTNSVRLDNYWANELSPEPVDIGPEGDLKVTLPQDCEFHEDGSFDLPQDHADFIENPDPGYCTHGPDWVAPNPDGSITLEANEHFEVHPEEGYVSMDAGYVNEAFNEYIPEGVEFNGDGTMTAQVPAGTLYDVDANAVTFPEGEIHMNEIPEQLEPQLNDNGSITMNLQEGMNFDPATGEMNFDNHWTNEVTPDHVEFQPNGEVHVDMPHDCHYMDDGSAHIPAESVDFIENPAPEYVDNGPDWVQDNPDGSVTVQPPEGIDINYDEGSISMSADMAMQELGGDLIPPEIQLNADGTADMMIPDDIQFEFNNESNSFTLTEVPEGFNVNEVPDFLEANVDPNGVVHVQLPEGCSYNPDLGSINLSNEIINEAAPEPIEFSQDGEFTINLPEDTEYFEDQGAFVISGESADFLDEGQGPHGEEGHFAGEQPDNFQQAA